MYAQGDNGQVTLDGEWLTIEREAWSRLGHADADKRIKLDAITAVKMRPAGRIAGGFIAFETHGHEFKGGRGEAGHDDNVVIFTRKHNAEFEALRAAVQGTGPRE